MKQSALILQKSFSYISIILYLCIVYNEDYKNQNTIFYLRKGYEYH